MPIEKKPFVCYTLDEDKKSPLDVGKIINVRLSPEEYKGLLYMGKILNISRDSTTLKKLAVVGQNVLIHNIGADFLKWLSDSERIKDEVKLDKILIEKGENVTQKMT